jgi:hypothetical protein
VGPYTIRVSGTQWFKDGEVASPPPGTIIVPLTETGLEFGCFYQNDCDPASPYRGFLPLSGTWDVLALPLVDYGGVPDIWEEVLRQTVVPLLEQGYVLEAHCIGSHGRTGTLIASLIAILEPESQTPDPIAAARERHCQRAVETAAQMAAVRAITRPQS